MSNGEKLMQIIKERGLNVKMVAEGVGIPYTTLKSMIDRGMKNPPIAHSVKIANFLDVKVSDFIEELNGVESKDTRAVSKINNLLEIYDLASHKMAFKPVEYRGPISAGDRMSVVCENNKELIELPAFLLEKYAHRKDIFVMKTNGDSMNKIIPDGSYVICIPVEDHHELKNGDIVIYKYNNESSMKRFSRKGNHIVFSPESNNEDFFDFAIENDTVNEVNIEAKVISYHVVLD